MHEMGIALQIVDIAKSSIPPQMKDVEVEAVNIRAGKLTAIVPESLRFCWEVVTKDTPLEGAKLNVEEVPIVARCKKCQATSTINDAHFKCHECESGELDILSGRELVVSSLAMADQ